MRNFEPAYCLFDFIRDRNNTRPRCIEEVTYMFSGEESPSRARKPQSFEEKLMCTREDRGASVWRRGTILFFIYVVIMRKHTGSPS